MPSIKLAEAWGWGVGPRHSAGELPLAAGALAALGEILLGFFAGAGAGLAGFGRRQGHTRAAGFGKPDGEGLLAGFHSMLAAADMLEFLAHELAGLCACSLALAAVAACARQRLFFRHPRCDALSPASVAAAGARGGQLVPPSSWVAWAQMRSIAWLAGSARARAAACPAQACIRRTSPASVAARRMPAVKPRCTG